MPQLIRPLFCFCLSLLIGSCTHTDRVMLAQAAKSGDAGQILESFAKQKAVQYQNNPGALIYDLKNLKELLETLKENAADQWGEQQTELPDNDTYVKYTQDYRARAIVDFSLGQVRVETINAEDYKTQLREAIVTTLLTTADPTATDIFNADTPQFNGEPFLYGQVRDQDGVAVRFQWRAGRFAEYLMATQLKIHSIEAGTRHSVNFPLVSNHHELRKKQYAQYVLASSARYQVSASLIYAIIETESSFNPFAVSTSNAYGLMQIIPASAGKDVYQRIKGRSDQPTQSVLFRPQDNIDIGTAYLHLLDDVYLKNIKQAQSREYATISAYNGGAGNVFKTFNSNRERAISNINRLSAKQVYDSLTTRHPRAESRRYLEKVLNFKQNY
ncbi:murein transglycosylase domain-containing protein [Planctobacterium marinum]|uniref:murein transglycosylase domain-containing protein n=1 Tax=Planctobacterium marinum TaxID=1631968 RepID=UPI001E3B1D3C|nr:murein transglycosylase domain-containing protein [Planctobacterium marinum]MCC2607127.1 murein transglycosylase domain-containing protein [Planctobacterium marinum]